MVDIINLWRCCLLIGFLLFLLRKLESNQLLTDYETAVIFVYVSLFHNDVVFVDVNHVPCILSSIDLSTSLPPFLYHTDEDVFLTNWYEMRHHVLFYLLKSATLKSVRPRLRSWSRNRIDTSKKNIGCFPIELSRKYFCS